MCLIRKKKVLWNLGVEKKLFPPDIKASMRKGERIFFFLSAKPQLITLTSSAQIN